MLNLSIYLFTSVFVLEERRVGDDLVDELDLIGVERAGAVVEQTKRHVRVVRVDRVELHGRVPVEERPEPGHVVGRERVQRLEYHIVAVVRHELGEQVDCLSRVKDGVLVNDEMIIFD